MLAAVRWATQLRANVSRCTANTDTIQAVTVFWANMVVTIWNAAKSAASVSELTDCRLAVVIATTYFAANRGTNVLWIVVLLNQPIKTICSFLHVPSNSIVRFLIKFECFRRCNSWLLSPKRWISSVTINSVFAFVMASISLCWFEGS